MSWYGVWGPRGLPPDITAKLQMEMAKVVQQPDVKQRMSVIGFESVGSTSDYFSKYIKTEMAKYEKVIKDAGIKTQ